jgi:hypothetical protein
MDNIIFQLKVYVIVIETITIDNLLSITGQYKIIDKRGAGMISYTVFNEGRKPLLGVLVISADNGITNQKLATLRSSLILWIFRLVRIVSQDMISFIESTL